MDLTKYQHSTPKPVDSDFLVIAFAKVGQVLREFPVARFYECFVADTELAADVDFNPFKLLRTGMSYSELELVLRDNHFRTFLSVNERQQDLAKAAFEKAAAEMLELFQQDLMMEFNVGDLHFFFVKGMLEKATQVGKAKGYVGIYDAFKEQVELCQPLIDECRRLRAK